MGRASHWGLRTSHGERGRRDCLDQRHIQRREDQHGPRTDRNPAGQHPVRPGVDRRRAAGAAAAQATGGGLRLPGPAELAAPGGGHGGGDARRGGRSARRADDPAQAGVPGRDLRRSGGPADTGAPCAAGPCGNDPSPADRDPGGAGPGGGGGPPRPPVGIRPHPRLPAGARLAHRGRARHRQRRPERAGDRGTDRRSSAHRGGPGLRHRPDPGAHAGDRGVRGAALRRAGPGAAGGSDVQGGLGVPRRGRRSRRGTGVRGRTGGRRGTGPRTGPGARAAGGRLGAPAAARLRGLRLLFDGGRLPDGAAARLRLPGPELRAWRFVTEAEAAALLPQHRHERLRWALRARERGRPLYLEAGIPVG